MTYPDPKIVEKPERYVAALARTYTMDTRHEIPALWGALWQHDFEINGLDRETAFGVSFEVSPEQFRYGAGYEVASPNVEPKGGCIITLAAGTYARFSARVEMANIPQMFDWVFSTWLPQSGRTQAQGAVFEVYPPDPEATETARLFEVWVPIKP